MLFLALTVLSLIILSAIFSGMEAAIFSLSITKAKNLAEESENGKVICAIREKPAKPISTIVILNNVVNIVGTYVVAQLATSRLSETTQTWLPFALTAAIIIFAEIIPKTAGERFCVQILRLAARPLQILVLFFSPIVWTIERLTYILVGNRSHIGVTESEIKALVQLCEEEGAIHEDEGTMIRKIFELDDVRADQIMTPRMALTWIRGIEPLRIAAEKIGTSQHSRVLVVGESVDDVRGVVLKSTILRLLVEGFDENALVEDFVEPVGMLPESTPADELLDHFKNSRVHLAVVVDQYGGVSGVVTLEDVLEVLTGEIVDETDVAVDMRELARTNGIVILQKGCTDVRHRILLGPKPEPVHGQPASRGPTARVAAEKTHA